MSAGEVENEAIRAARLVRGLLDWGDAEKALRRAIALLHEWRKTQPHPHGP
jgi:hypothetical protein